MFGIGQTELVIIVVFAFLLFGPDKLPQMGRTIGRALRQFRETQQKVTSVVQTEVIDPMAAAASAPNPVRKAAVDDDADADAAPEESVDLATQKAAEARKETFAERRRRLAAEKAARDAEAAGEEPAAESASDASSDQAEVIVAAGAEEAPAASAVSEKPAEDPAAAVASLYARRPRKHKAVEEADEGVEPAVDADPADNTTKGGEQ